MNRWELYIDESGELSGFSPSVVVGVLLRRPVSREGLRGAFDLILQGSTRRLAYPPHATELHAASGVLASWYVATEDRPLEDVLHAMASDPNDAVRWYADAVSSGKAPPYETRAAVADWLARHEPSLAEEANAESERFRQAMGELGRQLTSVADALVVGADASSTGLDEGSVGEGPIVDRYLSGLRALLERVVLLAKRSKVTRLEVSVAKRWVRHPGLPPVDLRVADVGHAVRDTVGYPSASYVEGFEHDGLRVVVMETANYDARVHPGIVVADFVANRLRRELFDQKRPWARLMSTCSRTFALPLEAMLGEERVPTLACDGEPRAILRDGLRGQDVADRVDALPRSWRREQVERWLEVAR